MDRLCSKISSTKLGDGVLAIYWLAQAGFALKHKSDFTVYIDPYFSNVVETRFGFKRQMACPISADEAEIDLLVCTHEHLDHMDVEALPIIAQKDRTHFAGPIECYKQFRALGVPEKRCHLLEEGTAVVFGDLTVHAVFADHGKLAVDALGIILDFSGIKVYHTGDTAYRPDKFARAIAFGPDILLPCINGKYGNMDAHEAALLTKSVNPRLVIPTHFGMFTEHNGDPNIFLACCAALAPMPDVLLLQPGEEYLYRKHEVEDSALEERQFGSESLRNNPRGRKA